MPPRRKHTTKKRRRRGGSLMDWAKKAHSAIKSRNGYSRALSYGYDKWGKSMLDKKAGPHSAIIDKGIQYGLTQLKQRGYGLRLSGNGLRRSGNGLRRSGSGKRMSY